MSIDRFEVIKYGKAPTGSYHHGLFYVILEHLNELQQEGLTITHRDNRGYILIQLESIGSTKRHIRIDKLYEYHTDTELFTPYHLTRTTNIDGTESKERGYFYLSKEPTKELCLQKITYFYDSHIENKKMVEANIHQDVTELGLPVLKKIMGFRNAYVQRLNDRIDAIDETLNHFYNIFSEDLLEMSQLHQVLGLLQEEELLYDKIHLYCDQHMNLSNNPAMKNLSKIIELVNNKLNQQSLIRENSFTPTSNRMQFFAGSVSENTKKTTVVVQPSSTPMPPPASQSKSNKKKGKKLAGSDVVPLNDFLISLQEQLSQEVINEDMVVSANQKLLLMEYDYPVDFEKGLDNPTKKRITKCNTLIRQATEKLAQEKAQAIEKQQLALKEEADKQSNIRDQAIKKLDEFESILKDLNSIKRLFYNIKFNEDHEIYSKHIISVIERFADTIHQAKLSFFDLKLDDTDLNPALLQRKKSLFLEIKSLDIFSAEKKYLPQWIDMAIGEGAIEIIERLVKMYPGVSQSIMQKNERMYPIFIQIIICLANSPHQDKLKSYLALAEFLFSISDAYRNTFLINLVQAAVTGKEKITHPEEITPEELGVLLCHFAVNQNWDIFDMVVKHGSYSNPTLFSDAWCILNQGISHFNFSADVQRNLHDRIKNPEYLKQFMPTLNFQGGNSSPNVEIAGNQLKR